MVAWPLLERAIGCAEMSRRSGARTLVLLSSMMVALLPARGEAQSCHVPSRIETSELGLRLSITQLFAEFDEAGRSGSYQGLITTVAFSHPRISVELALPIYRLEQRQSESIGPGDIASDLRVALLRNESGSLATGLELAVSFPSGDETRELGMGHVMLMPGAWLRAVVESLSVLAQLGYGHALGDDGHTAHPSAHGPSHADAIGPLASPRVNPMNGSELEHALGLSYALHPNLSVTGRWLGAVALVDEGTTRQVLAPGLQLVAGALDSALELQVPVAGDPFEIKLLVSVGSTL
jgi:hypothetical protein